MELLNWLWFFLWKPDSSIYWISKEWVLCGPSWFLLLTQDYLSEHCYSHISLILLIAWNLPCYLYFYFCLFVWLIKLKCTLIYLTFRTVSGDHMQYSWCESFFFYRGVEIFEKSQKGDQDFLVKIGGCSPYSEVVYRKGGKHCFSLVIYGFCSSNALYSASLSFRMSIVISD